MARIRSIKPEACKSKKLSEVSAEAERLFWRLLPHCDDEGRIEDEPRLIWMDAVPLVPAANEETVEKWLAELNEVGLIVRYEGHSEATSSTRFIEIVGWHKYQKPKYPTPSVLPGPGAIPPRVEKTSPESPHGEGDGEGVGEGVSTPTVTASGDQVEATPPASKSAKSATPSVVIADVDVYAEFERFWKLYPRKVGKHGSSRKSNGADVAYANALARGATPEQIIAGVEAHLPAWSRLDRTKIPHPSTWLNRSGWDDEPPPEPGVDDRTRQNRDATARLIARRQARRQKEITDGRS